MTYNRFAYVYDQLMQETPYEKWVEKVLQQAERYNVKADTVLDIACGTGELSVLLAETGFQVTGVDLSEDMLAVAYKKAQDHGLAIQFFQQNMAALEHLGTFDIITIFCDSLNYLQSEEEVVDTFLGVREMLNENGLFMFDVHSLYKMNEIFNQNTFALSEEEIAYIWQCYQGEWPNSVEHELSFFVLDPSTGKYDRFDELHLQRTYPIAQFKKWLSDAGFVILEITADFSDETSVPEQAERIFFTAKKRS